MPKARSAKFQIGAVVKHRLFPFRGVVFDIDGQTLVIPDEPMQVIGDRVKGEIRQRLGLEAHFSPGHR